MRPNVQSSTELRWFFGGSAPDALGRWFNDDNILGGNLNAEPQRSDFYLIAAKGEFLGVKLRGGNLEIKLRTNSREFTTSDGRVAGRVEDWTKWIWKYPRETDERIVGALMSAEPEGVEVLKNRGQRKYSVSSDGKVEPASMKDRPPAGCIVELTELTILEKSWWSLGFDAFGEPDVLPTILDFGVAWVARKYPGPPLQTGQSFGYPEWLKNRGV